MNAVGTARIPGQRTPVENTTQIDTVDLAPLAPTPGKANDPGHRFPPRTYGKPAATSTTPAAPTTRTVLLSLPQAGDGDHRYVFPEVTVTAEEFPGHGLTVVVGRSTDGNPYDLGWFVATAGEARLVAKALIDAVVFGVTGPTHGPVRPGSPSWQVTVCPDWCAGGHAEKNMPGDRTHTTSDGDHHLAPVVLSVERPARLYPTGWSLPAVSVFVWWEDGEAAPRVELCRGDAAGLFLTVAEAAELSAVLVAAAKDVSAALWGGAR